MIGLSQIERDKRTVYLALRQYAFIHIEQQQFVKIQKTRLKYAHYLYIRHGFTMERHRHALHRAPHQEPQQFEGERYVTQARLNEQTHLIDDLVYLILRF